MWFALLQSYNLLNFTKLYLIIVILDTIFFVELHLVCALILIPLSQWYFTVKISVVLSMEQSLKLDICRY
jgi:hypothetical protein